MAAITPALAFTVGSAGKYDDSLVHIKIHVPTRCSDPGARDYNYRYCCRSDYAIGLYRKSISGNNKGYMGDQ